MSDVFDHPWLSGLFADQEAETTWSAKGTLAHMLAFEAAYSRGLGAVGLVAQDKANAAAELIENANPDLEDLQEGTSKDGMPIPALVRGLKAEAGLLEAAIHTGTTSQDVMDTALALTLRDNSDMISARLSKLTEQLADLSRKFGTNKILGRTRMQVALPISVGHRIENWRIPLIEHRCRIEDSRENVERLQLGGAVGDGQAVGEPHRDLAAFVAEALSLTLPSHNWHSNRASLTEYANLLSLISGSIGKMGQDICLMAQQGVDEIKLSGGGGSSAMPHKQNPILAELLVTLARFNAVQVSGMHHALVHEQERSGSAWSLEWMLLPSMAKCTARSLSAASTLCTRIVSIGVRE